MNPQEHRMVVWTQCLLVTSIILCIFTINLILAPQDVPTIELVKKNLGQVNSSADYDIFTLGDYAQAGNKIRISIEEADVEETLYHEYAHWIYRNRMTKAEREEWSGLCNNISLEGYEPDKWCEEELVRGFSDFIKSGGVHFIILDHWKGYEDEFNFIKRMYLEYLK